MKIIIEGIKCTGKSSLVKMINEKHRGHTILEYRSYFAKGSFKYLIDNGCLSTLKIITSFVNSINDNKILLLRGHLFPFALARATNQSNIIDSEFVKIDKRFSRSNINLLLLTIQENAFIERNFIRMNAGRKVDDIDLDFEFMSSIQESYHYYYSLSALKKFIIDTSKLNLSEVYLHAIEGYNE